MPDDKVLLVDDDAALKKAPLIANMVTGLMFLLMGLMALLSPDSMIQGYGVASMEDMAEGMDDPEINLAGRMCFWGVGVNFFYLGFFLAQMSRANDLLTLGRCCFMNTIVSIAFILFGVYDAFGTELDGAPELKAGNVPYIIQFTLIALLNIFGFVKSGVPAPSFAVIEGKSPPGYPMKVPAPYWAVRFFALFHLMNVPFMFFPAAGMQAQGFPEKVWDGKLAGSMVVQNFFRQTSLASLWFLGILGATLMGHNTKAIYNMVRGACIYFLCLLCMIGGGMIIWRINHFDMSGPTAWAVMSILGILVTGISPGGMSTMDGVFRYGMNTVIMEGGPFSDISWAKYEELSARLKEEKVGKAY